MSLRYTKAELEELVHTQLENLNAMHDLLRIMKVQNDLIKNANRGLEREINEYKYRQYPKAYPKPGSSKEG